MGEGDDDGGDGDAPAQNTWATSVGMFVYGIAIGYLVGMWAMFCMVRPGPGRHWFLIGCMAGMILNVATPALVPGAQVASRGASGGATGPAGHPGAGQPPIPMPASLRGGGGAPA